MTTAVSMRGDSRSTDTIKFQNLFFNQEFPRLGDYNIEYSLARSCFQLWPFKSTILGSRLKLDQFRSCLLPKNYRKRI